MPGIDFKLSPITELLKLIVDLKPVPIAELLKLIGAAMVFGIGLYQYAQAQKWKRREFIASQIKEFEADKDIQLVMTMLDWPDRPLYFPSDTGAERIEVRVDEQ